MKRLAQQPITPAIRDAVRKKVKTIKWTFSTPQQALMVALAELGQSNSVIRHDCKMSDHEVTYGLMKSQKLQGMKGGYRRAWANGESDICKQVKSDLLSVLQAEAQSSLPKLIKTTPTPSP